MYRVCSISGSCRVPANAILVVIDSVRGSGVVSVLLGAGLGRSVIFGGAR